MPIEIRKITNLNAMIISFTKDLPGRLNTLTNSVKKLIRIGNISGAREQIKQAENLFTNGDSLVKNAVSQLFIFPVSMSLDLHHCNIKGLFPENMRMEYLKQVNSSGI